MPEEAIGPLFNRPPARCLLPSLLVVALALGAACSHHADPCEPSDGPQFRCWLEHQR